MNEVTTRSVRVGIASGDDEFVSGFRTFLGDGVRRITVSSVCDPGSPRDAIDAGEIDCLVLGPDASANGRSRDAAGGDVSEPNVPVVGAVRTADSVSGADVTVVIGNGEPRFDRLAAHVRAAVEGDDDAPVPGGDLYETVLESIDDAVYAIRADGTIVYVNERYARMKGADRASLIGSDIYGLVPGETAERARREREALQRRQSDVGVVEYEFTPFGGEPFPAEMRFTTLDDGGEIDRVGVIRDVSSRKEREELLREKNERLEEFAGIVSHDLRSPLNVAMGRLQLARAECDSTHLDDIERALDRMESLIEGLLLLAREGDEIGDRTAVDLAAVVERCLGSVDLSRSDVRIETTATVSADRERLRQLLENLLGNAVEHGGENVTVTVGDLPDGFYVADDGPGIDAAVRETLFDAGVSTANGGTGFGLAIVSQIVGAHGWEIAVGDSEAGGTRFDVTGIVPE